MVEHQRGGRILPDGRAILVYARDQVLDSGKDRGQLTRIGAEHRTECGNAWHGVRPAADHHAQVFLRVGVEDAVQEGQHKSAAFRAALGGQSGEVCHERRDVLACRGGVRTAPRPLGWRQRQRIDDVIPAEADRLLSQCPYTGCVSVRMSPCQLRDGVGVPFCLEGAFFS